MSTDNNYFYIKKNVSHNEYTMYNMIFNSNIVNTPEIYDYNKDSKTLVMRRIPEMSISDMYGDKISDVPVEITNKIRNIIKTLYDNDIEYPDITGYNFIEYQDKVWIIDFEHASFNSKYNTYDPFIKQFIQGHNGWNPRFA
jgi:tRNA A-37 threonylcarbamoyl transferase component Bud32